MATEKFIQRIFDDDYICAFQNSDEGLKISLYLVKDNNREAKLINIKTLTFEDENTYNIYLNVLERLNFKHLALENGKSYSVGSEHVESAYTLASKGNGESLLSLIYVQERSENFEAVIYSQMNVEDSENIKYFLESMGFIPYRRLSDSIFQRDKGLIK